MVADSQGVPMGGQEGLSHAGMALPCQAEDFSKAPLVLLTTASLPAYFRPEPHHSVRQMWILYRKSE